MEVTEVTELCEELQACKQARFALMAGHIKLPGIGQAFGFLLKAREREIEARLYAALK